MRNWFPSRSIRWQIIALAIGPVILVALLAILTQPLTPEIYESTSYAERTQIRLETIVEQVRAAESSPQVATILRAVNKTGFRVEIVPADELKGPSHEADAHEDVRELVRGKLPASFKAVLRNRTRDGAIPNAIVVQARSDIALAFMPAPDAPDALIDDKQINVIVKAAVAILLVLLSSIYAGWMISAPLTRFADAVHSLDPDEGPERPFPEGGSLEMRKLAASLNDMRGRVHDMLADRTRMVRAISHDLRTPLTRLRLKTERCAQPDLRDAMLRDIQRLDEMIKETLTFLSKNGAGEVPVVVDLPSLLQTVCADFADMGFDAVYQGPDRHAYPCKPQALTRAVTNLIDNATKFATAATTRLLVQADGSVKISVEDDGPGVPEELRRKVLEPFFKGDSARPANERAGFGLGLSIVHDIVHSHGGAMRLLDGSPGGLVVSLDLPAPAAQRQQHALVVQPPPSLMDRGGLEDARHVWG